MGILSGETWFDQIEPENTTEEKHRELFYALTKDVLFAEAKLSLMEQHGISDSFAGYYKIFPSSYTNLFKEIEGFTKKTFKSFSLIEIVEGKKVVIYSTLGERDFSEQLSEWKKDRWID